jgi:glyoxylase-like metal-dependent hydrolase (beta-lactamase superfamily II)
MAHLTISVPEEHVDELRRELLRAHGERAAELRRALDRYLLSHRRLDHVRGALVELEDLDAALGQLGWAPAAVPRAVSVTAHPELLADALRAIRGGEEPPASLAALLRIVERGT